MKYMPKFTGETLHYDIVGSFLRPDKLKQARKSFLEHKINQDELIKVENNFIADLVHKEIKNGLKIVTDGEFRRSYWHLDTFWGFKGIKHTKQEHGYLFHNVETRNDSAQVEDKISFDSNHPDLKAYQYLQSLVSDEKVIARQSIPSPAQCYAELVRGPENITALQAIYGDDIDALVKDLGTAYHDLILALYDAGCRDIKLDDCTWGMLADKEFWKIMTDKYEDIKQLQAIYLKFNNAAIQNLPSDLRISTHVCRGNYASDWAARGGYQTVAKKLFGEENVDAYYLEFDDGRSGDFKPLQHVSTNKEVVLGLITSKSPELENSKILIQRVKEASQYVPLERLSLSTQCGFASTEEGNHLTEEQQWAKIRLVVQIAQDIWHR